MCRFSNLVLYLSSRRSCDSLRACALLCICCMTVPIAQDARAQGAYPSRAVRYVLSDSPGSNINVPGAHRGRGTVQGVRAADRGGQSPRRRRQHRCGDDAARAQPNGYTMAQIATTHAVNATLYRRLGYDLLRDFAPVANLASGPSIAVGTGRVPDQVRRRPRTRGEGEARRADLRFGRHGHLHLSCGRALQEARAAWT